MALRVGLVGGRWLGIRCLEKLHRDPGFDVVGVSVPPIDKEVWWTDVVDEREVERLGYENVTPDAVFDKNPDLVFSVLTGFIFRPAHLAVCDIINLHPAALPYYRGCNSYAHAIMNGEDHYGVSLHYVDEGVDTGPVIDVGWIAIEPDDTGRTLYNRAQPAALDLFTHHLREIWANHTYGARAHCVKQDNSIARYYTRDSLQKFHDEGLSPMDENFEAIVRALTFPPHPEPQALRV